MIYLIKKAWWDPMENREDFGYHPVGYVTTLEEATRISDQGGYVDQSKTWSLKLLPPQRLYTFENVHPFKE